MTVYEYKVIPAPSKGRKVAGVKGAEARFAHTLEAEINDLAAEGWDYLRSDILPSEERQGLTSTHTVYRSVLVFRRALLPAEVTEPPKDAEPETQQQQIEVENEADPDDIADNEPPSAETDPSR
ncbi:DUF4177 domain-containing protein [Roseovarius gahaiensis]|uniref:DUF4177 domain-containing protein n=1 Tax=Roseovarius gahaiensis TaxID=2716691 RepID=UPI0018C88C73|nr:DUF4177 domain-containing protein [Roseovarius gahaiensis]